MTTYRYAIGDPVRFTPARFDRSSAPPGGYRVTRLMPEERGEPQYRIKSEGDAHERTAAESQLDRKRTDDLMESVFKT
jgi:hypothetical protein